MNRSANKKKTSLSCLTNYLNPKVWIVFLSYVISIPSFAQNPWVIDSEFANNLGSGFLISNTVANIEDIKCQSDKIFAGGNFTWLNGQNVPDHFLCFNTNGIVDTAFSANLGIGFNDRINAIAFRPGIIVGGEFTTLNGQDIPDSLVALNEDGTINTNFAANLGSGFNKPVLAIETGNGILVGGWVTSLNGQNIPTGLVGLNLNGTFNSNFNNNLGTGFSTKGNNPAIYSIVRQQDGKILVGGHFSTNNNQDVPDGLVRLNSDGTMDTNFNTHLGSGLNNADGGYPVVRALSVQLDGKILVGGAFSQLNTQTIPSGLIRLNNDGSLDSNFNINLGNGFYDTDGNLHLGNIRAIAVQQDGKILALGSFDQLNGQSVPDCLVRLENSGKLEQVFVNSLASGFHFPNVSSLALQPNGKVIVGGSFFTFDNIDVPNALVRLFFLDPAIAGSGVYGFGGGTDFNGDGFVDILMQKKKKVNILAGSSNGTFVPGTSIPLPPRTKRVLTGRHLKGTNYLVVKTQGKTQVNAYTTNFVFLGNSIPTQLPKEAGIKTLASGDIDMDGRLDLITKKGRNLNVIWGPDYKNFTTVVGIGMTNKLPGKIRGLYFDSQANILAFQKGNKKLATLATLKSDTNHIVNATMLSLELRPKAKVRGFASIYPITYKRKIVSVGNWNYTNRPAAHHLGRVVGPK